MSACRKSAIAPALSEGECKYQDSGFNTETSATSKLNRVRGLLENSQIGNSSVKVIRAETYVSETRNKKPTQWGLQVVFSCDDAGIVTERKEFTDNSNLRDQELQIKLSTIESTPGKKLIEKDTGQYSDTCYDGDGNPYACGSDFFWYSVTYVKVNSINVSQRMMLQAYDTIQYSQEVSTGKRMSLSDSLSVVASVLPNEDSKLALEYRRLVIRLSLIR